MSKIFDFIDFVFTAFEVGINFIKQLWHIVTTLPPILHTLFYSAPPVLQVFFGLFSIIAIILFVWRLIP